MRMLRSSGLAMAVVLVAGAGAQAQQPTSLTCAVINVSECKADGECNRSTIETANLPRFIREGRAWSAMVAEKTGQMSVAVVEEQLAFIIFGACTADAEKR